MRRQSTGFLLGLGMLVGGVAYSAFCLELTVLNTDRVASTAKSVLESAPVRHGLAENIHAALAGTLGDSPENAAAIDRAAGFALHDPRFQRAFTDALRAYHRRLFYDPDQAVALDTAQTSPAIRDALRTVDASLADQVSQNASIQVSFPTDALPDLRWLKEDDKTIARLGGLVALALLATGLATHSHPAWAVGKIGRWLLGIGLFELFVFYVVPHVVLPRLDDDVGDIAGSVGGDITVVLVSRALVLVALGTLLVALSVHSQRRAVRRSRTALEVPSAVAPEPHLAPVAVPTEEPRLAHEILPGHRA
ncbi:MAG: hypothetical protein U0V73_15985 [Acidimicrobiia bacterium]